MTYEEALKELKECLDNSDCGEQVYFPYVSEDAIRVAVYAIEKMIPKQVIDCICPSCHSDIDGCGFICWNCGQRLDWGDKNECND